jgi:monoamine oxidase
VSRTQSALLELLDEFGVASYEQYRHGSKVLLGSNGNKSTYKNSIPSIDWCSLIDLNRTIAKTDQATVSVPTDDPLRCKHAESWDKMTLADFIESSLWTKPATEIYELVPRMVLGAESSRVSLLYFLHFCNAGGGVLKLAETSEGSAQEWRIKGSTASLIQPLADSVGREKIFCDQPVTQITQTDNIALVQTSSGHLFKGRQIILAIPPYQISRIDMNPVLPADHRYLLQHMPVGHLTKFVATYETSFWRTHGFSGEIASVSPLSERMKQAAISAGMSLDGSIAYSPVCCVWDATTDDGLPALVGLQGGKAAAQWSGQPLEIHKKVILAELKYLLGDEAEEPIDFALMDWSTVPWNGGCPISFVTPGALTSFGGYQTLRRPWHRIHFAGTELATSWCGYMSGAVQSGYRAAAEVLHKLNPNQFPAPENTKPKESKSNDGSRLVRFVLHFLLAAGVMAVGWYLRYK